MTAPSSRWKIISYKTTRFPVASRSLVPPRMKERKADVLGDMVPVNEFVQVFEALVWKRLRMVTRNFGDNSTRRRAPVLLVQQPFVAQARQQTVDITGSVGIHEPPHDPQRRDQRPIIHRAILPYDQQSGAPRMSLEQSRRSRRRDRETAGARAALARESQGLEDRLGLVKEGGEAFGCKADVLDVDDHGLASDVQNDHAEEVAVHRI
jgi:hypothetical protein